MPASRILSVVVALAIIAVLPVGGAEAATRAQHVTVKLLTSKQAGVLHTHALRVRVSLRGHGRVRVRASSGRIALTRTRTVRFRRAGHKTLTLRLTANGRRTLGRCTRRNISASISAPAMRGWRRAARFVTLSYQRDRRHCPGTRDPAPKVIASGTGLGPTAAAYGVNPTDTGPASRTPGGDSGSSGSGGGSGGKSTGGGSSARTGTLTGYDNGDRCDPLDPSHCLYPWPNDHFTKPAPTFPNGLRLNLNILSMPRNTANKPIDPTEQNRNDGFSPGNMMNTKVPGLDNAEAFRRSGLTPISDQAAYQDPDAAAVVIDTTTGKRWPIWAEVDTNASKPEDRALILRPAVNFTEGHRYVVALRHLRDKNGKTIAPSDAFRFYRDGIKTKPDVADFEARRPHMEKLFSELSAAGIARGDLFLAWDFTVASERNLSERFLAMRNDAFGLLGDHELGDLQVAGSSPTITINPDLPDSDPAPLCNPTDPTQCAPSPPSPADQDNEQDGIRQFATGPIARTVTGTIDVPCYLDRPGCPTNSKFLYTTPDDWMPNFAGRSTNKANFICNIPRAALTSPARPSLYGHGLFGGAGEVNAGNVKDMGGRYDMMFCATDWIGMATADVPNTATILTDLSNFATLVDRVQQGMLNFLYLGRSMIHPAGMSAVTTVTTQGTPGVVYPFHRDMTKADSPSVVDPTRLFYDGNSQGGIIGGALAAVAPDYDRAVLGVPGMNYSTLLRRSSDFIPDPDKKVDPTDPESAIPAYATPLYASYPNELERPLLLSLIQLLWDRGEANGYAAHMTSDPLPDTPKHHVLMHAAVGDHQVTNWAAEVEARTIGAVTSTNPVDPGRLIEARPLVGIPPVAFPYDGSAIVMWDVGPLPAGTEPPPTDERPPKGGIDPHGKARGDPQAQLQKSEFLKVKGVVVDTCGGGPCRINGYTGPH